MEEELKWKDFLLLVDTASIIRRIVVILVVLNWTAVLGAAAWSFISYGCVVYRSRLSCWSVSLEGIVRKNSSHEDRLAIDCPKGWSGLFDSTRPSVRTRPSLYCEFQSSEQILGI